jgi:CheY-like chemotaxis protein
VHRGTNKYMARDLRLNSGTTGAEATRAFRLNEGLWKLRFATNGKDALRLARDSAPDLILLDADADAGTPGLLSGSTA